jgi:hypothetical protein
MQTHTAEGRRAIDGDACLLEQTDDLDALHRRWLKQVAAWRSAHEAAAQHSASLLGRMDAMIARLEAL